MRLVRLAALCLALAAPGRADDPGQAAAPARHGAILETATGARLTPEALAARLAGADIAVLGEVHDNAEQHLRQAWLVERIAPAAVAFEMVPENLTPALDRLRAEVPDAGDRLRRLPDALDWVGSGWPDWSLYQPVFAALGEARIVGAGVARAALTAAVTGGAAAAYGDGAEAAGLTAPLSDAALAELIEEMRVAHCDALPEGMLPGMVEAQRLRDARFAAATLEALEHGAPAVLVTGNGHARNDRGVPAYLARLAPGARVLTLGQIEVEEGLDPVAEPPPEPLPYDFVWFSAPAEREDPCAAFEGRPTE